jgi:hypothetical protein
MKSVCTAAFILLTAIVLSGMLQAQEKNPYEFADLDGVWARITAAAGLLSAPE